MLLFRAISRGGTLQGLREGGGRGLTLLERVYTILKVPAQHSTTAQGSVVEVEAGMRSGGKGNQHFAVANTSSYLREIKKSFLILYLTFIFHFRYFQHFCNTKQIQMAILVMFINQFGIIKSCLATWAQGDRGLSEYALGCF